MNRSAKITITLLSICVAVLACLLIRQNYKERERTEFLRLNCMSSIVSSHEINGLADALEKVKKDTSALRLYYQYEWIRDDVGKWNNSKVFNLAWNVAITSDHPESMADISWEYLTASSDINTLLVSRHDADELAPGEMDSLIVYMRRLAHATAAFENCIDDE